MTTVRQRFQQFRRSIAYGYLVYAILSISLTSLVLSAVFIYLDFQRELADLQQEIEREAQFLAAIVPELMTSADFSPLEVLMQQMSEEPEVVYSVVMGLTAVLLSLAFWTAKIHL